MVTDKSRAEIMIVDDSRETLQLLTRLLYKNGFDVRPVDDGHVAITSTHNKLPDLVLLDINMSGINGYEVCRWLKANAETEHIPIIFVSALDDVRNKVKAFEVGAVDYILKPFNFPEVLARIETHLRNSRRMRTLSELVEHGEHRHDQFTDTDETEGLAPSAPDGSHRGNGGDEDAGPEQENVDVTTLIHQEHSEIEHSAIEHSEIERISHNLRNPIHTVLLTVNLLKKRIEYSDPKVDEYFERIERSLNEINQIINETTS